jgi:hypothetical protein
MEGSLHLGAESFNFFAEFSGFPAGQYGTM